MSIKVSDPFNAAADPALPTLTAALNPEVARHEFKRRLPHLSGDGRLRLREIRVVRHKPGKRCVVEYDVEVERPDAPLARVTLIGKARARRSGNKRCVNSRRSGTSVSRRTARTGSACRSRSA